MTFAPSETPNIEKDELLVRDLAKFLTEQAIPKLVRDLQAVEGVPTDSESLAQTFHSHGINMRYIGQVYKTIADKELNHLKTFLEREAIVRSVKHLFNEKLRETPESHVNKVLAHMFNILLAPLPLVEKLDKGVISNPVT